MDFFNKFLSPETKQLRQKVLDHPFWKQIENGTLDKRRLGIFILQDYWLVKQAVRIDTLIIASIKEPILQNLLLERLAKRSSNGHETLFNFGKGVGISKEEFIHAEPLAGCMALTTFFYWMIDHTSDMEKIAVIDASKEVFSVLCIRVQKALMKYYNLTQKEVEFFTIHKGFEKRLGAVEEYIKMNCKTSTAKKLIEQAIRLSYENEIMFYDAILAVKL